MDYHIEVKKLQMTSDMGVIKAFADIVIAEFLLIKNCTVIERKDQKIEIRLPQKMHRDGTWRPVVAPMKADFNHQIYEAILAAYKKARDAYKFEGGN